MFKLLYAISIFMMGFTVFDLREFKQYSHIYDDKAPDNNLY